MQPNLLFINVDQMRADCLSILGHPVVDTPYLDQLASDGTLFESAYSATPTCVPARSAILSGQSQETHGKIGYQDGLSWNFEHTLPGELSNSGYQTQCVGKMHVYPTRKRCGFDNVVLHDGYLHHNRFKYNTKEDESFNHVDDYLNWLQLHAGKQHDLLDLGLDCNSATVASPWKLPEEFHPTNWVVTESIDFLRRRDPTQPFFLKMSFVRPHPPFDPPKHYFERYLNEEIPSPVIGDWVEKKNNIPEKGYLPVTDEGPIPEKRLKRAQAAYYALITHLDQQIGRFIMAMKEYGVWDNTVILFVSDHGELLGDHYRFQKSLPYEGSTRIPFILSDPGNNLAIEKGKISDKLVELRDIMPTFLDISKTKIPDSVDGKSVLPLAQGTDVKWRNQLHGEHFYDDESHHFMTSGKEKYIWFSQTGEEQFFDLSTDPQEKFNLINDSLWKERIDYWRNQLIKQLENREEGYSDGSKLIVGRKPQRYLRDAGVENLKK